MLADYFEVHDYGHAKAILATDYPEEYQDLIEALNNFKITDELLKEPGGNESAMPKTVAQFLHPKGWRELRLGSVLTITNEEGHAIRQRTSRSHKIDFVKNSVAFDFEWNSKEQSFDRDIQAMRQFWEYGAVDVGVIVTRCTALDTYFKSLGHYEDKNRTLRQYKDKYGASTTRMDNLLKRLDQWAHQGCPILAIGIPKQCIVDNLGNQRFKEKVKEVPSLF